KLTSDKESYPTDNITLGQFFKAYMEEKGFSEWLEQKLRAHFDVTKDLLTELVNLVELEKKAEDKGIETVDEFMLVDDHGDLKEVDIDDLKINAAASLADKMHDASLTLKQLFFLGMDDQQTIINHGVCSAAMILQFALEKKLALQQGDKDMIIMLHEIEYENDGRKYKTTSTLKIIGEDDHHTAMAKTVGLPLGIAAKQILNGNINLKGLVIPIEKQIYEIVLPELEQLGIIFQEETIEL
nr:hypothetical protein [Flavisolibacter sp.]